MSMQVISEKLTFAALGKPSMHRPGCLARLLESRPGQTPCTSVSHRGRVSPWLLPGVQRVFPAALKIPIPAWAAEVGRTICVITSPLANVSLACRFGNCYNWSWDERQHQ